MTFNQKNAPEAAAADFLEFHGVTDECQRVRRRGIDLLQHGIMGIIVLSHGADVESIATLQTSQTL